MMHPSTRREITVLMRSQNDASLLPTTLAALDAQTGVSLRLLVFDSASTDESCRIFEQHGYDTLTHLAPGEYRSSKVLNAGVRAAPTELVAFVNSDAIMMHTRVLALLADAIERNPRCAGSFARQIPRPNASLVTRLDYDVAFADRSRLGPDGSNISLVTSMIRKSVWAEHPFDEALTFAEDYVWSDEVRRCGWVLEYVPEAVVEHSHDYGFYDRYRRAYGDSAALARIRQQPPPGDPVRGFLLPWVTRCGRDALALIRKRKATDWWEVPLYRAPWIYGEWRGSRAGWAHFRNRTGDAAEQPTVPGRR